MIDIPPDSALLERTRAFVGGCNGNILAAAEKLGIQYHFLRRYLQSGRGWNRNVEALRTALIQADVPPTMQSSANVRDILQTGETRSLTKAILNDLLGALEAVEARP